MSKSCITGTASRGWTKEEMMSYLDWNKAEDENVEALAAKEMGDNPLAIKRHERNLGKRRERLPKTARASFGEG